MTQITILHTSDMHSRLNEPIANQLRELKHSIPGALLLDSGDAIKSGNVTFNPWGEAMLGLMNSAGYDAMCVGNREYHFMAGPMKAKTFKADFPILSANLVKKNDDPAVLPFVDFEIAGTKVRVMGLSVPCVTRQMFVHHISSQYFQDPVKSGVEMAAELKKDTDILIALTHIGLRKDTELAEKTQAIDLILGGHTHTVTAEPLNIGNTRIMHHGYHAKTVGKVTLNFTAGKLDIEDQLLYLES